ncbi:spindle pole body formation-associated protein-domain-containing protein [Copromyces sp. CBS 386.78]|nr:spindle pole body formation-associated protein-domain-containing protein [Copromyces sp. CBS 386.78]
MISWALRRNNNSNAQNAQGAPDADESANQLDVPDTPAPVFAVRALKTALFGTPAKDSKKSAPMPGPHRSPTKPTGILLTPGVGAARRKRVSFGHGVKAGSALDLTATNGFGADGQASKPKTRLNEILENSRTRPQPADNGVKTFSAEDAWDEDDVEYYDDSDLETDITDATVDLNEPHSRSGRYWKAEFEKYHADARAEMEKLVRYKQLAKSYAKLKDAEAIDLNKKLKEEQERVQLMEEQIAEMTRHVNLYSKRGGAEANNGLMEELNRQKALTQEYRAQVEELEEILREDEEDHNDYQTGSHASYKRRIASPRTHRTLLEAQRELRKARSQVRELGKLRDERDRMKTELKFAEQRASALTEENKKLNSEVVLSNFKVKDLEKRLAESKNENLVKDNELQKIRADYDKLKEDAKSRYMEARQVLEKKNDKISELQDEIATLKAETIESKWAARMKNLEAKLKASHDKIKEANDREEALKFLETAEEESTLLFKELDALRKTSMQRGILNPAPAAGAQKRIRTNTGDIKRYSYEDEALVSSRALREKIEADMAKNPLGFGDTAKQQAPLWTTNQPERTASRRTTTGTTTTAGSSAAARTLRTKPSLEDILGKKLDKPWTSTKATATTAANTGSQLPATRRTRIARPLSNEVPELEPFKGPTSHSFKAPDLEPFKPDVVPHSNIARLEGFDIDSSSVWNVDSTTPPPKTSAASTSLPADRRAAAIARLQRKRAEREKGLGDRNKENLWP